MDIDGSYGYENVGFVGMLNAMISNTKAGKFSYCSQPPGLMSWHMHGYLVHSS